MSRNEHRLHYIHRTEYTTQERLVGIFVLLAILLLIGALAFNRHSSFLLAEKFTLQANMRNAQGVSADTVVRVSGVEVGKVTQLDISADNRIAITMRIREQFHDLIREDSVASLNKLSVLGNAAIDISPGDPARARLADGATIRVREAPSIDELIARVTPAMENLVAAAERIGAIGAGIEPEAMTRAIGDLASTSENLRDITGRIRDGEGAAGRLLMDESFSADLDESLRRTLSALQLTEQRLRDIGPVLANADSATGELPALIRQSRQLAEELNVTVRTLNAEAEQLPDMIQRTRLLMDEADRTLRAIQNTWPVSSSMDTKHRVEVLPPQTATD